MVDVFSRQLTNDLQQGKIAKILRKYYVTSDIAQRVNAQTISRHDLMISPMIFQVQCEDRKNRLGFSNTFIPFGILLFAVGFSLIFLCFEAGYRNSNSGRLALKLRSEEVRQKRKDDLTVMKAVIDSQKVDDLEKLKMIKDILDPCN